ncbi:MULTISPECIES: hypothetical protein [unclassified Paenibacillus]|uniref:Uncharacterized protein n=1 Tax=Paenibacillus provencensis TaxID=441151 RepID=A0ABW3Q3M6_9BACL|nr:MULTISPECIES: hypothetical protein [unclassified Paenibacillus]MCM3130178.1 hypothetical protein [Paenibacillus sp. MER 78]SDX71156.1 hypothetical protein SAMN05518848_11270 [Paenibacillus sp. PDC88]SFS88522.1 hypothetical protein SAMN04488601_10666 [Paenibacillus sp. 453mf]
MEKQTIFVSEMPGSNLVLFHVVGSRSSDVITKTEAFNRGVTEIRKGNLLSGPAAILNEIRLKGQTELEFDLGQAASSI